MNSGLRHIVHLTGPARLALCAFLFCLVVPASADQTDPRLDQLFDQLINAPNALAAQGVEQAIWEAWFATPDSSAHDDLMAARDSVQQGDVNTGSRQFDELVRQHPDYAEGWNQRAIVRYLLGDVEGSLEDIDQVLALEPRHFGALSGRGQCYLRLERYADALAAFEDALDINPWIRSIQRQMEMLKSIVDQQTTPI